MKDKLVIGICNGCQILVNLGIVPTLDSYLILPKLIKSLSNQKLLILLMEINPRFVPRVAH